MLNAPWPFFLRLLELLATTRTTIRRMRSYEGILGKIDEVRTVQATKVRHEFADMASQCENHVVSAQLTADFLSVIIQGLRQRAI